MWVNRLTTTEVGSCTTQFDLGVSSGLRSFTFFFYTLGWADKYMTGGCFLIYIPLSSFLLVRTFFFNEKIHTDYWPHAFVFSSAILAFEYENRTNKESVSVSGLRPLYSSPKSRTNFKRCAVRYLLSCLLHRNLWSINFTRKNNKLCVCARLRSRICDSCSRPGFLKKKKPSASIWIVFLHEKKNCNTNC